MACYIASNENRFYVSAEPAYGEVSPATAGNRISAVRLSARQRQENKQRRDKTGSRTFSGVPTGVRTQTEFELRTYLSGWEQQQAAPPYGPLFQSAFGSTPLISPALPVQAVENPTRIRVSGSHGLVPGQAISIGSEIRFVTSVTDASAIDVNAPFTGPVSAGTDTNPTVTYRLGRSNPSISIYDYWSPDAAVQRLICGAVVNEMRVAVNSDFHEFRFSGPARDILDNISFSDGQGGLDSFPEEPDVEPLTPTAVPGNLGQVWLGANSTQFYTLTQAEIALNNALDARAREFGLEGPRCITGGERRVTLDFELYANDLTATTELYEASRQRAPFRAMFQLGQQSGQLCGIFMKSVVGEVPDFDDSENRLLWRFRNCRAQGSGDDEIVLAFA